MPHCIETLTQRIAALNAELVKINNDLTEIDGENIGHAGLNNYVVDYRENLVKSKTYLEKTIAIFQAELDELTSASFTDEQQTIVDEIIATHGTTYEDKLEHLKCDTSEKKTEFFDIYSNASSNLLKKIALEKGLAEY